MTELPFRAADESHLIAPRETFVEMWAPPDGGRGITPTNVARASLALETAHQVARTLPGLVLKGGTPLHARISWPPRRASVDVDLEWTDPTDILEALKQWARAFETGTVSVEPLRAERFSSVTHIIFQLPQGEIRVRVDVAEPGTSSEFSQAWSNAPGPWKGSAELRVPTLEAQAAQKLLLSAPPDFGRHVEGYIGRRSLCKDLFDLSVLGGLELADEEIVKVAAAEIRIKGGRIGLASANPGVLEGAMTGWLRFATPPGEGPEANYSLWRAFGELRNLIAAPFGEADLRIAGGCARHSVDTILGTSLNWADAWTPQRAGSPRRAWQGKGPIVPVIEVSDQFEAQRGLLEAWAKVAL